METKTPRSPSEWPFQRGPSIPPSCRRGCRTHPWWTSSSRSRRTWWGSWAALALRRPTARGCWPAHSQQIPRSRRRRVEATTACPPWPGTPAPKRREIYHKPTYIWSFQQNTTIWKDRVLQRLSVQLNVWPWSGGNLPTSDKPHTLYDWSEVLDKVLTMSWSYNLKIKRLAPWSGLKISPSCLGSALPRHLPPQTQVQWCPWKSHIPSCTLALCQRSQQHLN